MVRRARSCLRLTVICLLAGSLGTPLAAAHTMRHHRHRARHAHHHSRRAKASSGPKWSATAPCANADTPATSASVGQMDAAVNCLINQQRLRFGLPAMNVSTDLNHSAQGWTNRMVSSGQFTHGSNSAFSNRLLSAGFHWGEAGENIATGYLTPRDAVAGWMASPDHCQNILDPDYREMGTGENPAPVGNFASGAATWTQDLGLLIRQSAPSHNFAPQRGCPYTIASSPGA